MRKYGTGDSLYSKRHCIILPVILLLKPDKRNLMKYLEAKVAWLTFHSLFFSFLVVLVPETKGSFRAGNRYAKNVNQSESLNHLTVKVNEKRDEGSSVCRVHVLMFPVREAAKQREASVMRDTKEDGVKHENVNNQHPWIIPFQRRLLSLQTGIFAYWPSYHPEIISSTIV